MTIPGFETNNCRVCIKVFCCEKCRLKHETEFHQINPECDICIFNYVSFESLSMNSTLFEHIKQTHLPMNCAYCNKMLKSIEQILQHKICSLSNTLLQYQDSPITPFKIPILVPNGNEDNHSPILEEFQNKERLNNIYHLATSTPMQQIIASRANNSNNLLFQNDKEDITPVDKPKFVCKSIIKKTDSFKSESTNRRVTFSDVQEERSIGNSGIVIQVRTPNNIKKEKLTSDNNPDNVIVNQVSNNLFNINDKNKNLIPNQTKITKSTEIDSPQQILDATDMDNSKFHTANTFLYFSSYEKENINLGNNMNAAVFSSSKQIMIVSNQQNMLSTDAPEYKYNPNQVSVTPIADSNKILNESKENEQLWLTATSLDQEHSTNTAGDDGVNKKDETTNVFKEPDTRHKSNKTIAVLCPLKANQLLTSNEPSPIMNSNNNSEHPNCISSTPIMKTNAIKIIKQTKMLDQFSKETVTATATESVKQAVLTPDDKFISKANRSDSLEGIYKLSQTWSPAVDNEYNIMAPYQDEAKSISGKQHLTQNSKMSPLLINGETSNLWTSLSTMVKNVFKGLTHNNNGRLSSTTNNANENKFKRRLSNEDLDDLSNCSNSDNQHQPLKRFKLRDIKCRRSIRDSSFRFSTDLSLQNSVFNSGQRKFKEIHIFKSSNNGGVDCASTSKLKNNGKTYCDKATQTDDYLMYM